MFFKRASLVKWLVVSIILVLNAPTNIDASFWDGWPIISQVKSFVQVVAGDIEGARKTQINFSNQAPVVSQAKSFVEATIMQNPEAARETQEKFLKDFIEPAVDNTPVIGHIKGGIHMAVGDTERGEEILKGASSATASAIGAAVGGPAGAVAGTIYADNIISQVNSLVKGKYSPYGTEEYFANIDKKTAGEHFDALIPIFLDAKKKKN